MSAGPARLRERMGLVAAVYGVRAGVAALAGLGPAVLAARVSGALPGGDAELFAPGSVVLVETLRRAQAGGAVVTSGAALLVFFGVLVGALPLGVLLVGLARPDAKGAEMIGASARAFARLSALCAAALVAEALTAAVVISVSARFIGAERSSVGPWIVAGVVTWVAVAAVGCVRDLAAASVIARDASFTASLADAIDAIERRHVRLALGYLGRSVASIALVLLVVWWVPWGSAARASTLSLALVHQTTAFALVLLHASWLRVCMVAILDAAAPKGLAVSEVIVEHPTP